MGLRGPKRGAINAGRPKIEFSRDTWDAIEKYVEHQAKISEICDNYKISYDVLARLIRDSYGLTIHEFWERYANKGRLQLREKHWDRLMSDKCHPNVFIHGLANYLHLLNTNMITKEDNKEKKDNNLLSSIQTALKKLSDNKPNVFTQINNITPDTVTQQEPPKEIPAIITNTNENKTLNNIKDIDNIVLHKRNDSLQECNEREKEAALPLPSTPLK